MTACSEFEVLLSLRAAGALEPGEERKVEEHLAACAACRAEAEALAETLSLARLPPTSAAEQRAVGDLAGRTLRAFRRADRSRALGKRVAAAVAIAAAAAGLVLAPAILRKAPTAPGPGSQLASARVETEAAWQAPDPDALWEEAGLFDDDSSTATSGGDATDAVLAALEY